MSGRQGQQQGQEQPQMPQLLLHLEQGPPFSLTRAQEKANDLGSGTALQGWTGSVNAATTCNPVPHLT